MQIKTTMHYHFTHYDGYYLKKEKKDSVCWQERRETGTLCTAGGDAKMVLPLWKTVWWFSSQILNRKYDPATPLPGRRPWDLKAGTRPPMPQCPQQLLTTAEWRKQREPRRINGTWSVYVCTHVHTFNRVPLRNRHGNSGERHTTVLTCVMPLGCALKNG